MKNFQRIPYALLLSGLIAAVWILTQIPNDSGASICGVSADGFYDESKYDHQEIELGNNELSGGRPLEGMFTAVQTLDESTDETEMDAAAPPAATQAWVRAAGVGRLRREELMTQANRIMSDLYRDGILTKPVEYACAFPYTPSGTGTTKIIFERFRRMHQKHLALVKRALSSGDRDSLMIRGWSEIRTDLAKIQKMAADLKYETALAAR
jgi:hypothetical protein